MSLPGIEFDGVWKKFRRGERHDSLRDLLPAIAKSAWRRDAAALAGDEFWAVRDVSFDVRAGQALGIIGPNGAGKSTILKLLTRILPPTRGRCEVRGRLGALIEVAAGFHPDLTGRENVYLQGAIMGMRRMEIDRKFDRIVDFSGISEFIDTPVKRYSSGMNARLGFSIAAHLDPDVLIIDEVLSVGDASFQEQCVSRMRELARSGVPLVFVSHNLSAVLDLCTHGLLLVRGAVAFAGDAADTVAEYRRAEWARKLASEERRTDGLRIASVQVLDEAGHPSMLLRTGGAMTVRIFYEGATAGQRAHFAVDVHREDGICCYGINTRIDRCDIGPLGPEGYVDLRLGRVSLLRGSYVLSIGILDEGAARPLDVHFRAYPFSIASDRHDLGVVALDHSWSHRRADEIGAAALGEETGS